MAEYALITPTAVALDSAVPFPATIHQGCCCIRHKSGSGIFRLKGGSCCNPARYHVTFNASVVGVAGPIRLAIYQDGEQLAETTMSVVPAAATDIWSVSTDTEIIADVGGYSTISVRVVAGDTVTVNTANITIKREVA